MEKKKVTVRIGGKEYTLLSGDPEEHVRRVGVYVDRRMEEIDVATKLPTNMVAVLTALNMGDELLKAQDENTRLRRELTLARQELATQKKKEK